MSSELNPPRQSQGLISVSPSKGREESALKAHRVSLIRTGDAFSTEYGSFAAYRVLSDTKGPRASVNKCSDSPVASSLIQGCFFLRDRCCCSARSNLCESPRESRALTIPWLFRILRTALPPIGGLRLRLSRAPFQKTPNIHPSNCLAQGLIQLGDQA
jgi:hypothetical protein